MQNALEEILSRSVPGRIATVDYAEAQRLIDEGAKVTVSAPDPEDARNQWTFLSWKGKDESHKLFVYRGAEKLQYPVAS